MRFPKSMPEGGTIGFAAPSFGCATEPYKSCFDAALDKWRKEGYKTKLGPNCYASDGIGISSTPESCGRELTDMYLDKESDILLSCGGGELMCEILDHVDFDSISKADPKWYMGYSDNTNFTFTLATICDTASIYGPCANEYGMSRHHQSLLDAWTVLTDPVNKTEPGSAVSDAATYEFSGYGMWEKADGRDEEHPYVPYNLTEKTVLHRFIGDGDPLNTDPALREEPGHIEMSGRLLGGCLDCLVNLCGTQYDQVSQFNEKYASDGVLWFIEACDLNVMSIRRAMWELEHAGWFDAVSGFVIGRPLQFNEPMMGLDQYMAVYDIISRHKVPVLMDADLGHLSPMVPLITGSFAYVSADGDDWKIRMELR